ncbi:GNAT family N-acetyltransferase [Nocardioides stalactiti]|uniref:GNAT family N-acetyltransferase n=1 Tax=Nocardioides stalactiti TaxID=2755356 RepID=UPI001601D42F|nr:GNAT family N-acetyltransferase [Nocardioides stalactiti]
MTDDRRSRAAAVELSVVSPDEHAGAQHALASYFAEIDARFAHGYTKSGPVAAEPGSTYVLATIDGEPVAYGGLRPTSLDATTTELKRMWVHPDWRGAGLGSRMLRHLEALAAELGARRLVLDTNEALAEAITMYDRAGYRRIDRYEGSDPHATHFFEKTLGRPNQGDR